MEKKRFICINCPMGCRLTATLEAGAVVSVEGNACGRGEAYARQEAVSPRRVLTCLMRLADREEPLSVKTSAPVPKELLFRCANAVYSQKPKAPVHMGEVLIRNICGTGADVVATKNID